MSSSPKLPTPKTPARRTFLQQSLWLIAALPLGAQFLAACDKSGGGSATPPDGQAAVKEDNAVAASLGYKEDATQVDTAKFPKRKAPGGEKEFCHNCQFYTASTDGGWGSCTILRPGLVKSEGWCNSWTAKPAG